MLNGLKFWFLRKFKPNDEKLKEEYSEYVKKRYYKTISRLQVGFQQKNYVFIRYQIIRLMKQVGSPLSFKHTSQFFDTIRFTDSELIEITGDADGKIARERIENLVTHLLTTKKYKKAYWESYIDWILILAP